MSELYTEIIGRLEYKGTRLISEAESDKLLKSFPELKIFSNKIEISFIYVKKSPPKDSRKSIKINIYPTEDEWYYVKIWYRILSPFDGSIALEKIKSYKCDQWDGLTECLFYKVINCNWSDISW